MQKCLFFYIFLTSLGGLPLCPEILRYFQRLCLFSEFSTVRDAAGFEPGTTVSVVWSATNEPPHHRKYTLAYEKGAQIG